MNVQLGAGQDDRRGETAETLANGAGALDALRERPRKIFTNVQGVAHTERLIAQGEVAIGNTIYANKNGNGNVASGDGYRYRGRRFLQITGRENYRRIGKLVGMPLEAEPERLGEPGPAAHAAAVYWRERGINVAAEANDCSAVTLLVNGKALLHLKERMAWLKEAEAIWRAPHDGHA